MVPKKIYFYTIILEAHYQSKQNKFSTYQKKEAKLSTPYRRYDAVVYCYVGRDRDYDVVDGCCVGKKRSCHLLYHLVVLDAYCCSNSVDFDSDDIHLAADSGF